MNLRDEAIATYPRITRHDVWAYDPRAAFDRLLDVLDANAEHISDKVVNTSGVVPNWMNEFHVKAMVAVLREDA